MAWLPTGLPAGPQCLVVRAPLSRQDFLKPVQVEHYLTVLTDPDQKALRQENFAAETCSAYRAAGASSAAVDGKLVTAVLNALDMLPQQQSALREEFVGVGAIDFFVTAFKQGKLEGITEKEFPDFVLFCLAYRIHCYFEPQGGSPLGAKASQGFERPEVILVFGGPGCGKRVLCSRISEVYGYKYISVCDIIPDNLRATLGNGTFLESQLKNLPTATLVDLIQEAMEREGWTNGKFLIDGFPSTLASFDGWKEKMQGAVKQKPVLFFDCSAQCMEARYQEQMMARTDWHRIEDLSPVKEAIRAFKEDSAPLLQHLQAESLLRLVPAEQGVDQVWQKVRSILGPTVVFVLGGPGSGKGTVCSRIKETFGYTHLSAGDLLREERKRPGSELGELIESCIKEGKLVPAEITVRLLEQAMLREGWQGGKYLVDGFPRSFDNLMAWEKLLAHKVVVKFCLFMDCGEKVMEARLLERGKTSGRSDDNIETIRKRFVTFYTESLPVVEKFRAEGGLRRINAEQQIEDVWNDVQALFGPQVVFVLGGPGSGKGTQCSRISANFGYKHLSAGDLLREERQRPGSAYGELIETFIKEGKLVPVSIIIGLIEKAMLDRGWEGGKYLIDGFPRSNENLEGWNKAIGGKVQVRFALFFECSERVMEIRLIERGKTSGRADDNIETIKKRFATFQEESVPVAEELQKMGKLRRINAERDPDTVWKEVQKLFNPTAIFVLGGPGAGKGTQCTRISHTFGFQHLSAGDLLREERNRPGSALGELIESHIKEGKLVPVEIVVKLLQKAMEERGWEGGKYLIDGFPRSYDNLCGWQQILEDKVDVRFVLFFECTEAAMEARLLERGKTSGRADDNPETIRKRFRTFQEEHCQAKARPPASLPVVNDFGTRGRLRRIDAEQSVEEVWDCVQEVMHQEMDTHLMNQAVVFLKPHARNKNTERFLQSFLTSHKITILKKGIVTAEEIIMKQLFDRQYFQLVHNARAQPSHLKVPEAGQKKFADAFGVAWAAALGDNRVVNADVALVRLGISAKVIFEAWSKAQVVKMAPSIYVTKIDGKEGDAFVINGFVPHWREVFPHHAEGIQWFVVEFDPSQVSWRRFHIDLIGNSDPTVAPRASLRSLMMEFWKDLGLAQTPNTTNNCVHASAGPLEALRERMLWTDTSLTEDPLGRLLLASGIPQKQLEAWLEDAVVEGWETGTEKQSGKIFDLTEDVDTALLRESAVRFVAQKAGDFEAWLVRARPRPGTASGRVGRRVPPAARPKRMTILHFNDVYNVEPRDKQEPVGGIARFVTRMKELKAESVARGEQEAVTLFSGDAFNPSLTSTMTRGRHMVPALNAIGIYAACFGNHDFDFGVDQLTEMAGECSFPWLISNVTDKATGLPLAQGHVTLLLDFHGRKIGLIGLVEKEWLVTLATIDPTDVEYEDFVPCARRLATQLKQQEGCEMVIALTHMRVPNDELLAHEVAEVDLILGGHDHHYDVKQVGPHKTWVLKSGTDFRDITELQLEFIDAPAGSRPFRVVKDSHVEIVSSIKEDPEMKDFTEECIRKVGAAMDEIIGESTVDLDCRFSAIRTRETNIGNFVADIIRRALKADLTVLNSGTLRADTIIPAGPFRMRDLVNLLPMLDELCLLQLNGSEVLEVLENSVSQYPRLEGRFAQVSGVSFSFDAALPSGHRLLRDSVRIGDQPIDLQKSYKLATKDYLRIGKDGYDVFKHAICLADGEQAGILPTLVREYFKEIEMLNGLSQATQRGDTKRSSLALDISRLSRVGAGPDPMKRYAIEPKVEDRVVCLHPVDV